MARRRKDDGRYTVSGPDVEELAVVSVGQGVVGAQIAATKHLLDEGEFTYYVRDLLGTTHARVTKLADEPAVETLTY